MPEQFPEIKLDVDNLYREETFTDQRVGTIRRMTPVSKDGSDDSTRPVQYIGQAQMMTPAGPLPLTFELEASSLEEALEKFAEGANQALEETMKELQEMRRQQASQIVVPGEQGSKIQMP
ncbi:MAG: hypothetical protein R3183_04215 [Oleiphilaceae bacterium]|nr:hypothetical protein [Oleiphilaceae bacterium]